VTDRPEHDLLDELRQKIGKLTGYDERALDTYAALSLYLARRSAGATQAEAARIVCGEYGHDAPRGLCLRCGLGVDAQPQATPEKDRAIRRAEWLAKR
jgi:hypothetical protein